MGVGMRGSGCCHAIKNFLARTSCLTWLTFRPTLAMATLRKIFNCRAIFQLLHFSPSLFLSHPLLSSRCSPFLYLLHSFLTILLGGAAQLLWNSCIHSFATRLHSGASACENWVKKNCKNICSMRNILYMIFNIYLEYILKTKYLPNKFSFFTKNIKINNPLYKKKKKNKMTLLL